MKRFGLSLLLIALVTSPLAAQTGQEPPAEPAPKSMKDQASYGIGISIGRDMKSNGLDVNAIMIARGIIDALEGKKPALTDEEIRAALAKFQEVMQQQMAEKATRAKQLGEQFLAANGKKEGVVTLPSGLQYKVLKQGTGASPKATDTVRTHYHGTFIDGQVFDSSVERGEPAEFPVNRVIPGWTEALQLMKVGDKWQLVIPSELAYGKQGSQGGIAPDSVLVFEVELLDILK